jgi:hypothetical protein
VAAANSPNKIKFTAGSQPPASGVYVVRLCEERLSGPVFHRVLCMYTPYGWTVTGSDQPVRWPVVGYVGPLE